MLGFSPISNYPISALAFGIYPETGVFDGGGPKLTAAQLKRLLKRNREAAEQRERGWEEQRRDQRSIGENARRMAAEMRGEFTEKPAISLPSIADFEDEDEDMAIEMLLLGL